MRVALERHGRRKKAAGARRQMSGNDLAAERTGKGRLDVAVLVPCYNEERAFGKVVADFGEVMARIHGG